MIRSSNPGTISAVLARIGTVLDASPHQSSAITSNFRDWPGWSAARAHSGTCAILKIPSHNPRCLVLADRKLLKGSALSHRVSKSSMCNHRMRVALGTPARALEFLDADPAL